VIDLLGEGLRAVATRSAIAYPMIFAAGAVTGVGPCAAPRYVAVAALAAGARRPWSVLASFGAGVAGAYVALGLAAGTLETLWSASRTIYFALAAALAVSAIATLLRHPGHVHATGGESRGATLPARASLGGVFLLGASSAFVVAPCCTPVLAAIAGLTVASGHLAEGSVLLATFGCGHALPVLFTGAIGAKLSVALQGISVCGAPAVVAGGLMLALAAYYGILA
jgi:cytochrome c-type biogenesis protein